jgi:hypothetical protein
MFNDCEAVHAGKQAVDDHDIRIDRAGLVEALDAGRRPIDLEAAVDELGRDLAGRLGIILDEEQFRHRQKPSLLSPIRLKIGLKLPGGY